MNRKTTLAFFFFLFTFCAFANFGPAGNLTIISENGAEFYLFVNGKQLNNIPKTNIRLIGLQQIRYNVNVVFANRNFSALSKENLAIADGDGELRDVTYKITRGRRQQNFSFRFYSMFEAGQNTYNTNNTFVIQYQEPQVPVYNGNEIYGNNVPMHDQDFNQALETLRGMNFEDSKYKVAVQITSTNKLSVNQIIQIAQLFNFEDTKLDFAKFAYEFCIDQNNYYRVNSIFKYSSSTDKLIAFITKK